MQDDPIPEIDECNLKVEEQQFLLDDLSNQLRQNKTRIKQLIDKGNRLLKDYGEQGETIAKLKKRETELIKKGDKLLVKHRRCAQEHTKLKKENQEQKEQITKMLNAAISDEEIAEDKRKIAQLSAERDRFREQALLLAEKVKNIGRQLPLLDLENFR